MKKFYYIVIGVIVIRSFAFLTSPLDHPFEDYFFMVLAGLLIMLIGKIIHLIICLIKKIFKKVKLD